MGRPQRRTPSRPSALPSGESFFVVMLVCSLLLHLATGVILLRRPLPRFPHSPATISVDLVLAPPVAHPQRGGGITVPVKAPTTTSPVIPVKVPPAMKAVKDAILPTKPAMVDDAGTAIAIKEMQNRRAEAQERKSAEDAIAKMKQQVKPTSSPPRTASVTSPPATGSNGAGSEAGSERSAWLLKEAQANWKWPVTRKDLSAELEVEFDASGKLVAYRFVRSSGDARFDDALKRAILSLKSIPKSLRPPFKETFIFNLKDA